MDAASRPALRTVVVAFAIITLTACGSPTRIATLYGEPDLARIDQTIPDGFSGPVNAELRRLRAACAAIDPKVGELIPEVASLEGVTHLRLTDGQCQWIGGSPTARTKRPSTVAVELIIGILANPGGDGTLDQTTSVLKGVRPVVGVGDRAVLDLQTRTLYVLERARLWYLQLIGPTPGVEGPAILAALGRVLLQTSAAR
jgi:hypothetical protein